MSEQVRNAQITKAGMLVYNASELFCTFRSEREAARELDLQLTSINMFIKTGQRGFSCLISNSKPIEYSELRAIIKTMPLLQDVMLLYLIMLYWVYLYQLGLELISINSPVHVQKDNNIRVS